MHCLPFKNRSRTIRPEERRRESLHAHHSSQHPQTLWRTRGRRTQDDHEPHPNPNSAGRIESDGRGEVLASNPGHVVGGNETYHADRDSEERDEQDGSSHVVLVSGQADDLFGGEVPTVRQPSAQLKVLLELSGSKALARVERSKLLTADG